MSGDDETRSSLIDRVRLGDDTESWKEFVELYEPLLERYIRGLGMPDSDVSDVVQEVFIRLLRSLPTFKIDRLRARFRTWLWKITRNAVTDLVRRRQRRARFEDEWASEVALSEELGEEPDEEWLLEHRRRILEFGMLKAQAAVEPRTWQCFAQHLLGSRPAAEVADGLGLSANVVYVNSSRVLDRLRVLCREFDEELGDS